MKYLFFIIIYHIFSIAGSAQILQPSSWTTEVSKTDVKVGDEIELIFKAKIIDDWYLYSSDFDPECGPMVTTFYFEPNSSYELVGELEAINPVEKYDEIFECTVKVFKKEGEFRQRIKVLSPDLTVSGNYEFQVCSDVDGKCIPFDQDFTFDNIQVLGSGTASSSRSVQELKTIDSPSKERNISSQKTLSSAADKAISKKVEEPSQTSGPVLDESLEVTDKKDKSLIWFMIFAFIAGLAALLTPCVFPMIPMTVSYFTGKGKGAGKAFLYGFSIIIIYTVAGSAIAPVMGPETANHLSTEWLPNLIFFAVFVIFALSFFGLFDINLPNKFINKMDQNAGKRGFIGIFFMAFTLVLVSFSCTGPIVGSLLVASAGGEVLKPILGMFAFSLAFAIPFTLFAIFPGWLNNLPKSGGWLNSVKVVLGFVELALAFKFLSIADQAFHWGILDRDINIAIWIVIFSFMGFYLLGKIRLPHDNKLEVISVPRLMMAILTFSFVLYLIPGMWGAPLKALAGYLPPMYTHDFNLISLSRNTEAQENSICDEPKYGSFLHLPHGLHGYFDYEQALACAREQDKPLLIDFTGHGCTNCREMEAVVWSDPEVLERMREDYVIVALYVDDKTELPEADWYVSEYDNKVKKTIGKQNADFQITHLQNNAQPFYVIVGKDEKVLVEPVTYDRSVQNFIKFLDKGKKVYDKLYED